MVALGATGQVLFRIQLMEDILWQAQQTPLALGMTMGGSCDLPPGGYAVILSGVSGRTGIGIVEVFEAD